MRIAICDDDEWELFQLQKLLKEYQLSREISADCRFFHNSTDFLCEIEGGEYDVILLDVLMPGINGVQAARELREMDKNVKIIFVSSSPEFALESYSVGAYYYLIKPIDANALFPLLDKAVSELMIQQEQGFVLKNRKCVVKVPFQRLAYVEVINKTVSFHLADGTVHEITAALADFEEKLLSRPEFFKTHRSYLVNLGHVEAIRGNCVMTKNGESIPISRQRRSLVQDAYVRFSHQAEALAMDEPQALPAHQSENANGSWRILLVDDDDGDSALWARILRNHGCIVQLARNGREAFQMAEEVSYDCVLLDVMIPGEDVFSICEKLRKRVDADAPIIFLSCLTEADRQIEGFAAGGIDYITKDTPEELFWAKVETRIKLASSGRTQLCFGPLLLDLSEHKALMNEKELLLTPVEFDILQQLSGKAGRIFTPEEIFAMVWGEQPWDGGQMVQRHMSHLRRKLEKAWGEHHFIETVWGKGYRFVPAEDGWQQFHGESG